MKKQDKEVSKSQALAACGINFYQFTAEDKKKLKKDGIEVITLGKTTYMRKKK